MDVNDPHPKNPGKLVTNSHIVHILNEFIQIIEKTVQSIAKNISLSPLRHLITRKLK